MNKRVQERIKKSFFLYCITVVGITILFAVSFTAIDKLEENRNLELAAKKNEENVNQSKLEAIVEQRKTFIKSLQLWKKLTDEKRNLNGIKIDEGRKKLEQITKDYKILNLQTDFTVPEISKDLALQTETTHVSVSTMALNFDAPSDVSVFGFINAITTQFPGYIRVTSLQMSKTGEINEEVIQQAEKGKIPTLVKVIMKLEWRDLESNSVKPITSASPTSDTGAAQ